MKKLICLLLVVMLLPVFSGCAVGGSGESVADAFLSDIAKGKYESAYRHLSAGVQNDTDTSSSTRVTEQEFVEKYTNIFDAMQITSMEYEITGVQEGEIISLVDYHMTYHSELAGDMEYDFTMTTVREDGNFYVEWSPSLIFPVMTWGDKVWVTGLSATRGEVIAEQTSVAQTVSAVTVSVTPSKIEDREYLVSRLSALLGMTTDAVNKKIDSAYQDFAVIKQFYPDELSALTEEQLLMLPGVGIDSRNYGAMRYYPEGSLLAHTIGYLGYAQESDIESLAENWPEAKELYTTDSLIGKTGIERVYEKELRGSDGKRIYIAGSDGATKQVLYEEPAQNGLDVQLTIDIDLQRRAETLIEYVLYGDDTAGVVIVMDPTTGAVEAITSYPDYSLNDMVRSIPIDTTNSAEYNRAVRGLYPPGSIFKPFTAAFALESGTLTTEFEFTEEIEDDKWIPTTFGPWEWSAITRAGVRYRAETLNMRTAIIHSDNIYFAYAALSMGPETFQTYCAKMKLGEKMPFELNVATSQLYNEGSDFNLIMLADSGYGQAEMLASPLQMAATFCAFANGGDVMEPYIVEGLYRTEEKDYICEYEHEPKVWIEDLVLPETVETLEPYMKDVVSSEFNGTGQWLKVNSCTIAGKTGTAEVGNDKSREISWFVGYRADPDLEGVEPRLVLVMLEVPVGDDYSRLKFDIARELLKASAP